MRDHDLESQRYNELNEKIDKLSEVFLVNQKAVKYVGEVDMDQQGYHEGVGNGFHGVQEEVNYLGNQNNYQGGYQNRPFNNNFRNNNLSYISNNVENPQDQYYPPRAPQGNQFQPRPFGNSFGSENTTWRSQGTQGSSPANGHQGDMKYRPPGQPRQNAYPPAQASEQDDMKSMMKQIMEGQARAQSELIERIDKLERKFDSSHAESQVKFEDIYSHLKILDNQISQVAASTSQRSAGSLPEKPETNPKAYCNAISLRSGKELASEGDVQDASKKVADENVVQLEEVQTDESKEVKDSSEPEKEKSKSIELTKNYIPPPPYRPKLPFPGRFKKQLLAEQKEKFLALMDGVEVTLPLMDVVKNNPTYSKLLKEMITNKQKLEEEMVMVSYECSSIIKKTLPTKLADPGSFTLPCALGSLRFSKCLCDLGSSVNLMPLTVAKKIGVTTFQQCRISLVLADRSVRIPVGIIENLPLRVGDHDVPTDFVVLEMDEEPVDPLILGRPFLATAGALIDCRDGKIRLQLGDSIVNFDIKRRMEKPDIGSQCFSNQTLIELESKMEEELCIDDPLKAALMPEEEDPWSVLKAPNTELKQLPPERRGDEKVGQKQGGTTAQIDRSPATDRSIPPWRSWRQQLGSIEPAQIDRSQSKELCEKDQDRSILSRTIDPLPDDNARTESSKGVGNRPATPPTKSSNKKKVKMRRQGRAPLLHE